MWSVLCAVAPTTWITDGIRRAVMPEKVWAEVAKAASVAAKAATEVARSAAAAAAAAKAAAAAAAAEADAAWERANSACAQWADAELREQQEKEWEEERSGGW